MKLIKRIALFAMLVPVFAMGAESPVYCNPLNLNYQVQHPNAQPNPEIWVREGADPAIAIFKDKYYLFSSVNDRYWQSENLVDWKPLKPSSISILPGLRWYAPTVVVIGDTLYFKDGNGQKPVYSTQTPEDPDSWKQVSPEGWRKPDAQFFLNDDGKLWINYGCFNDGFLFLQEMDTTDFMPKGEPHKFFMPDVKNRGWEGVINGKRGMDHSESHGWVEGGQLVKHNGTYYFIYSLSHLNNGYANGVYTSTNILGPYTYQQHNPITQKLTGFTPGSAHGEIFKDRYENWWTLALSSVWTYDRFERRISLFPTSIDANGTLLSDTRLGDYPTIVPQELRSDPAASLWNGMNLLSVNRPVNASSTAIAERPAEAAVDEEIMTFWAAATGNEGEWFEVDLQNVCTVEAIHANFGEFELKTGDEPDAAIRYQVLGSTDGQTWSSIIDKRENTEDRPHDFVVASQPMEARYVRLVNTYTPYGGKFALRGLRVFGKGHGVKPAAPEFQVDRKTDRRKMEISWEPVEGADGYVVRYGQEKERLYLANQYYNTNRVVISCLESGTEYLVTVDAFNQNGYTKGKSILPVVPSSLKNNRIETKAVKTLADRVHAFQIKQGLQFKNQHWVRGTYYAGLMAMYESTSDRAYLDDCMEWGKQVSWRIKENAGGEYESGAYPLICAQIWYGCYQATENESMIQPSIDFLNNPNKKTTPVSEPGEWYFENAGRRFVDGLFTAPPALAMLYQMTGDEKYANWMDACFWDVHEEIFDPDAGLFYRDARMKPHKTRNGKKVLWSRGNGWAFGGVTRILKHLPADHGSYARYKALYIQMAESLAARQQIDGFWRPNLDDPEQYNVRESSGTGFFTYGIAWGINNGILDRERFLPVAKNGWAALASVVNEEGAVTWNQPPGGGPGMVKETDSTQYGSGIFLLAASELFLLTQ